MFQTKWGRSADIKDSSIRSGGWVVAANKRGGGLVTPWPRAKQVTKGANQLG
ncbi:hypothetical protein [Paraflavitalea sp. CAU 1676]|uniref:hypothetical protein n=1 Tax=Paraflavitalea sp. CAU 1676 TaxID=3032598 RepID=UPI0023DAE93A|nr:hypothetical protein [Paraflavitalea sp. CAU 1676]MDF2193228.1 hypothetical protein [Paraflavitalea sp. CAU 1676]